MAIYPANRNNRNTGYARFSLSTGLWVEDEIPSGRMLIVFNPSSWNDRWVWCLTTGRRPDIGAFWRPSARTRPCIRTSPSR